MIEVVFEAIIESFGIKEATKNLYCINCGTQIDDSAKFCPACGEQQISETNQVRSDAVHDRAVTPLDELRDDTQLQSNHTFPAADSNSPSKNTRTTNRKPWYIAGGVVAGIAIVLGGGFLTTHYLGQSDLQKAQAAATSGHYALALRDAEMAVRLEPYSSVSAARVKLYDLANRVSSQGEQAEKSLKGGDFQGAIAKFKAAQGLMEKQADPLFKILQAQMQTGISSAKVGLLEQQALKSTDVSNVAGILTQIDTFDANARKQAQNAVQSRLDSLASQQVARDLSADNFDAATQLVQVALKPDSSDAKIANLNQTIQSAKGAYEKRQQQIEEQSLAQAAQNANLDQHPIIVNSIGVTVDGDGNTDALGSVTNQATHAIGDVELTIVFYDGDNNLVDTEYTYVSPSLLNSGDSGSFDVSIPDYYGATSATVTYYTWLNE
jgi:predicted RNA-binding Zn-ribbon protein involved in translation (DUF1610 family)